MLHIVAIRSIVTALAGDSKMDIKGKIKNKKSGVVRSYTVRDGKVAVGGTDIYFRKSLEELLLGGKWEVVD